ncbi:MAG: glycosyltransferase family 2 protein [Alicyclobacillus sp.]|nr:glycosyltransferase family 2 protein [Alicyclobacillus sp.]
MTVLNEAGALPALLDSIEAQTLQPDEVIIVDGGSHDGTRELLETWAEVAAKQPYGDKPALSVAEAEYLLAATLDGVAKLLQTGLSPRDIVDRVKVPGGVTEAALRAISEDAVRLFRRLHETTGRHSNGSVPTGWAGR